MSLRQAFRWKLKLLKPLGHWATTRYLQAWIMSHLSAPRATPPPTQPPAMSWLVPPLPRTHCPPPLLIPASAVVAAGEAGEADTITTINSSDSDKGEVGVHLRGSGKRGAPKMESPPSSANKEEEED